MNQQQLERAALDAADRCLKAKGYIAFDEMFREMGKLDAGAWEDWRHGRVPYLERVIGLNLNQVNLACRAVQASARRGNLRPSWTAYFRWGKGPRVPLRFTKSGDQQMEQIWATRFVGPRARSQETTQDASISADASVSGRPRAASASDPAKASPDA